MIVTNSSGRVSSQHQYYYYLNVTCRSLIFLCFVAAAMTSWQAAKGNTCNDCHLAQRTGFAAAHAFAANDCTTCHGGNDQSRTLEGSHESMTGFPGLLDNAARSCGSCHADKVASVSSSLMNTGHGMVDVTRKLVDDASIPAHASLQSLGHGPADSMLRKLCASCHLGQDKTRHELDPVSDRGGGCLACHINSYPENQHPPLTRDVSDARCFGCHSRSARISLSYAGLGEIDAETAENHAAKLRLPDGRHMERKPADIHFTAGMTCTECHKGSDLMSSAGDAVHQRDAVAARCDDCHSIAIAAGKAHDPVHDRLECATCHSQWAPQCFSCHMEFNADEPQWDHIEQRATPGRWHEQRGNFRNEPGALGINEDGRIELFVPGMIMTLVHPDWDEEKFVRAFAPISPHTIGPARSCESCHESSVALGLGEGTIQLNDGKVNFTPARPLLRDGLPADAWTNIDSSLGGTTARDDQRPLNREEMEAVLTAPLD